MKVLRFRAWNLNAGDFQDTVKFYRDILGADEKMIHQVAGVDVSRMGLADMGLGIFDASGGERPGVPHHTFDIEAPEDSQALVQELEGKGIKVEGVRIHQEDKGYSVYVNDPAGNRLELSASFG